ncbi:nuclear transport factor 2 family protein [Rubrolithibacter danxiaensis]|uniref:nuclear transport factor 2 family protein n=1 Tax=Rubrolithibacter danxiaensis TaxID=3390805 RepID=UPI003BF85E6E
MKTIVSVLILFVISGVTATAQTKDEKEVAAAVEVLKQGIVNADRNILESIAADELVYGHSSGKVQNKAEFVEEIVSGKPLDYITVDLLDQTIKVAGETAIVRHIFTSQISNNGTPGNLKIGNMLIWQKQHGKWKLLARQAYKM